MKLVELLAKELYEWPEDACSGVQDPDCDGTIWFLPEGHGLPEFSETSWKCYGSNFDILISRPSCLAEDYRSAVVTCEDWIAECKRISQPKAEEVEVKDTNIGTISYKVEIDTSAADQAIDELAAKWGQLEGPLKWRDCIIHCQAIIEDCEREIAANENLLVLEGFALIPAMTPVMGASDIDMSDWRNWRAGDIVECVTSEYWGTYTKGKEYKVELVNEEGFSVYDNHGGTSSRDWFDHDAEGFKFIRRP